METYCFSVNCEISTLKPYSKPQIITPIQFIRFLRKLSPLFLRLYKTPLLLKTHQPLLTLSIYYRFTDSPPPGVKKIIPQKITKCPGKFIWHV